MNNLPGLVDDDNINESSKFLNKKNNATNIDDKIFQRGISSDTAVGNGSHVTADNTTVLIGIIILVSLVTIAQYFAAFLSHSLALTADAIQNTVDLSTYIVNLYVEYVVVHSSDKYNNKSRTHIVRLNMGAATFSLVGLLIVGFYILSTAMHRMTRPNDAETTQIDSTILLIFTIIGLFCDIGTMIIFCVFAKTKDASNRVNVNMASAMAHIYTDFIRSSLVTLGAFIIYLEQQNFLSWGIKEDKLDAILSLIVVACIFTASFFLMKEIIHLINHGDHRLPLHCQTQPSKT